MDAQHWYNLIRNDFITFLLLPNMTIVKSQFYEDNDLKLCSTKLRCSYSGRYAVVNDDTITILCRVITYAEVEEVGNVIYFTFRISHGEKPPSNFLSRESILGNLSNQSLELLKDPSYDLKED